MTTSQDLVASVGHPLRMWEALKSRVQSDAIRTFGDIEADWFAVMWALDAFRTAGLPVPKTGNFDGFYRKKGNWFAELIALLLQNRTAQPIGSRSQVQGFSQLHQIDVAWPARRFDPLVCIETKVMGASATPNDPARPARSDFTNRRREVKFAATDLKLYRRQEATSINHWDVWRADAPPQTYFLWAARLDPVDSIPKMLRQLQSLTETYLDGAGMVAWKPNRTGDGYELEPLAAEERTRTLDDVLHRIEAQIKRLSPGGQPPEPVVPPAADG